MSGELLNVLVELLRIDGGTQPRAALNETVVDEYAEIIKAGGSLPPVIVYFDGSEWWLADGFHRYHAHRAANAAEIPAEVRDGTRRDAILFSVGANAAHGLRRTNEDKRRAVETLLKDAEWSKWSDREIARQCSVSDRFVNGLRASSANDSQIAHPTTRTVERNGKTYEQNTANIGKAKTTGPILKVAESDPAPKQPQPENAPQSDESDADDDVGVFVPGDEDRADAIQVLQEEIAVLQVQVATLQAAADPNILKKLQEMQAYIKVVEGQRNDWQNKCNDLTKEVKRLRKQLEKVNA